MGDFEALLGLVTQHSPANNRISAPVRYSDVLAIRMEKRLREAIQASLTKYGVKEAEYVRNALWTTVAFHGSEKPRRATRWQATLCPHLIGGGVVDIILWKPAP